MTKTVFLNHGCEGIGNLYPITTSIAPSTPSLQLILLLSPPVHGMSAFVIWARPLYPLLGTKILLVITSLTPPFVIYVGKYIHLPSSTSNDVTLSLFNILRSDLRKSPITSFSGYKYYILFLYQSGGRV